MANRYLNFGLLHGPKPGGILARCTFGSNADVPIIDDQDDERPGDAAHMEGLRLPTHAQRNEDDQLEDDLLAMLDRWGDRKVAKENRYG